MPPETNPRMVFERLFGADDVPARRRGPRAAPARDRRSILDVVLGRAHERSRAELGPTDRRKLDEYLDGVREIERQIEQRRDGRPRARGALSRSRPACPADFADYVKLMFDLQVAAFQADLTRVSTFMIGREGSLQSYPEIGVPDSHHPLTHHRGQPELVEKVTKINTFHVELFAHFVGEAQGDARRRRHAARPLDGRLRQRPQRRRPAHPRRPAGAARGPGRRQRSPAAATWSYPTETPMTNLYLTLLDRMGVQAESLGDSTGRLAL